MRVISLFAFILVSTTLLSESHHAGAIGVDSSSHGLIYDGRMVRRYGVYKGLQERAEDPKVQDAKGQDTTKIPAKVKPQTPDNNKVPIPEYNKPPVNKPLASPAPPAPPANKTPAPPAPLVGKAPAQTSPTTPPTTTPTTIPKDNVPKKDLAPAPVPAPAPASSKGNKDDTTNTTLEQETEDTQAGGGTPTVSTGTLSSNAVAGMVSVGGVFVLVGGLFAFSQRKKNKEMTKSIVSNSAKAWEQQSSAYEVMEEETKPLGTFTVVATYSPTLSDELDIQPGDKVTILVEYDDGWVQGINETRGGIKGVFPRHCVDMSQPTDKTNKSSKRSSSMGGGYTEVDLS